MVKSAAEFDAKVKKLIRSEFYMISSSADHQESEETYNANKFELPNPAGKAGGACTSAFLQALYDNGPGASWVDTLKQMRSVLKEMGYDQIPQLTSSRMIEPSKTLEIVPKDSGRRRALLIGINYVGQKGALTACHNDVNNLKELLTEVYGFQESEMMVLMDDGHHHAPTRRNIEDCFIRMTRYAQPNDVCFVSFSGHGGQTEDLDGDEDDGFDETLIPVDFQTEGHIVDDDILKMLVKPMPVGVHTTVLMDCCHSGTVMDLPYKFGADDARMTREKGFNMEQISAGPKKKDDVADAAPSKKEAAPEEKEEDNGKKKNPKKKKKKKDEKKEDDNIVVGPKLDASGAPQLPVRKAAPRKQAAPPPGKKCTIM